MRGGGCLLLLLLLQDTVFHETMLENLDNARRNNEAYSFDMALQSVTGLDPTPKPNARDGNASVSAEAGRCLREVPKELSRGDIEVGLVLGAGKFGFVFDGCYNDPDIASTYPVAVKQVREDAPEDAHLEFVEEATLMAQLQHTNVVRMAGVITKGQPILVVLEYCSGGHVTER